MDALVVYKKSIYELYSNSEDKEVRRYLTENPDKKEEMRQSHLTQQQTLETVVQELSERGIDHEIIYRADLEEITDKDLVITVGGDGTLLEVSHYVKDTPILGVNSNTSSSVGYFCCANKDNVGDYLSNLDSTPRTSLNRLELTLDDEILPELVLNDILVAHRNPAAMTRYFLEVDGVTESQRNSGLLISTAAGSTAFMYNENGEIMPLDSTHIQYIQRSLRDAQPQFTDEMQITSQSREGMLYIDGEHLTYKFSLGSTLQIANGTPLNIVGDLAQKRAQYL